MSLPCLLLSKRLTPPKDNLCGGRVRRLPQTDANIYPIVHRGWKLHRRRQRLGVYGSVSLIPRSCLFHTLRISRYQKRRRAATKPDSENAPTYTYHFVGYSSLYPFYCFPSRVRMRLSQFVILSPWQQKGHGCTSYLHAASPLRDAKLEHQRNSTERSTNWSASGQT